MTKTVVISGANRGIGLALTQEFVQGGYRVFAGVRTPGRADALKKVVGKGSCTVLPLDICDDESVNQFSTAVSSVDILINNAGALSQYENPLIEVSLAEVERNFQVNVLGTMRLTKALLPQLLAAKFPILANISSLVGSIADNKRSGKAYGYRMSKTALNMFTKSFSVDFPHMIAVALHPGWVQTDMGGPEAPLTPSESAAGLYQVITGLKQKDSGRFVDFRGESLPW